MPELAALVPRLREAGLRVLLPAPAPLEPDPLRRARAVDGPATAVGLVERWEPWARTVAAAVPLAGPVLQVTVRGWPRGAEAAAELVDLVGRWCGEVVAVVAAGGALPAARLPDGEAVAWAVLTGGGATVLVSHEGPGPAVRLSSAGARLEASPRGVRWAGGDPLPLQPLPAWVPPAPRGVRAGLVAAAAGLARDDAGAAELGDLLVAAQVLAALRDSARTGALVPVS
ncbi:MAG TPA: hypothetical protein VNU66_06280 [Mycobacteriales bacterium]|nr:hypothetical protein [Mycobacteriales bacterium]